MEIWQSSDETVLTVFLDTVYVFLCDFSFCLSVFTHLCIIDCLYASFPLYVCLMSGNCVVSILTVNSIIWTGAHSLAWH